MKSIALVLVLVLVLTACAHAPKRSGATERAVVVVRECVPQGENPQAESLATVYATDKALRIDMNCGRRPFRIVYKAGAEEYVHYDVNEGQTQTFTTAQVQELVDLRKAVATAALAKENDGKPRPEESRLVAALLASADDAMSPLRKAKFRPASIGETIGGVHCRRFEVTSGEAFSGEACLAKAAEFGIRADQVGAFAAARQRFVGLLGTNFEIFDPVRTVDGTDYLVVRLTFGSANRGIAVPRLRSASVRDVPVELWDSSHIAWRAEE